MVLENEIAVQSDLQAASFSSGLTKAELQIKLVFKLLSYSIKEKKAITKNDIIECYLDYIFHGDEDIIYRKALDWKQYNPDMTGNVTRYTIREKHNWYCERSALEWFKKNLGAAILKGKLLVIPIIEI